MNYKVLYRKYRPKSFDDVVGQCNTINILKESIFNEKISHAYLFSGPRGTGKTSCAKIFAKAINCSHNSGGNPCENCENCVNFSNSSDIFEIDAASNNGVDQIREIIDNIKLSPIHSKYKVYIIDEVHMLSVSAFNALLLTLEEPPSHVVFILATTDVENVPITVLSRCQRLDFKKISTNDIISRLKYVSECEKINISDDAISEIAEYCEGGLRDALSILDQVSKLNKNIEKQDIYNLIGGVSAKELKELINNIELGNIGEIQDFVQKCRNNYIDYKNLIKKLISEIKNEAVLIKSGYKNSILSYDMLKNLCFELAQTIYKSNVNIDSYSLLELILISPCNIMNVQEEQEIVAARKTDDDTNVNLHKSDKNTKSFRSIRINNCFVGANKSALNDLKIKFEEFLNSIELKNLKGLLLDTSIVLASDKIAVIKTKFDIQADNINNDIDIIEDSFNKYYNLSYNFVGISDEKWNDEMERYKENKKKNIKYVMLEENKNIDYDMNGLFLNDKIEVK